MMKWVSILFELTKFKISLFATLSASAGFILAKQELSREIIIPVIGILFLACGSCALNQYQERIIDGRMERTKNRPLPSGRLDPVTALRISLGLITLGSLILCYGTNRVSWSLGLFALFWYNGVYTYLKRKTAFAAIPGALVGVIPPVIGWASGGGSVHDPRIWVLAFFFFIWQIPHFWLLLLSYGRDYDQSGLPSLSRIFTVEQLKRIILIWMLSTAVSSLFIPLFGFVRFYLLHLLLLVATFWLVWNAVTFFFQSPAKEVSFRCAFTRLNIYVVFVVALLSLDRLLNFSYPNLNLIAQMLARIGFRSV
jgi:protoheme IX farnesyltransferase